MSGEIDVTTGYTFSDGESITWAKLRLAVEGIVATIQAGAITENELADGSIGLDKLAEDVLSAVILPDGSVGSSKIATAAVSTSKIANDAVDRTKIAADVAGTALTQAGDGSLSPVADEATLTVGATIAIAALGIVAGKIADNAITTAKIANGNVTEDKIGTGAATNTKIGALAVDTGHLAANALGQLKFDATSMSLACGASADEEWQSWAITPRAAGGTVIVLVAATVSWSGTAPTITFKLFDDTSEEASVVVTGFTSGEQMVALLIHAPGDTAVHVYRVKVNPDQACTMDATSRILWEERVEK